MELKGKDIEKKVVELAKQGQSAARIGTALRDEHKVLDVKAATGKQVTEIIAEAGSAPALPDDLLALIRKAVLIRKHLELNKHDQPAKRGLTLTESKVLRLSKYYKGTGRVASTWNYNPKEVSYLAE